MNQRLLLLAALAACTTDMPERGGPIVRDSAGVRIVENTTALWQPGREWRLSEERVVDIGGGDTEEDQLFRVAGALRLSDGRIVVGNGGTHELRIFDADGAHLLTAGRKGKGPGEFETFFWIGRFSDDSILAYDISNRRVSVYSPEGGYVRSVGLELPSTPRFPEPFGVLIDGRVVAVPGFDRQFGRGERRDSVPVLIFAKDGGTADTIAVFPGREQFFLVGDAMAMRVPIGFGRNVFAGVGGNRIAIGANDTYEISVFESDGSLMIQIRDNRPTEQVSTNDVDAWRKGQIDRMPEPMRTQIARLVNEIPVRETYPAFSAIVVDTEGAVWVEDYRRPAAGSARWTVFSPDGALVAQVTTPLELEVYEIGPDYILGLWRDADDVEHIQLYDLIKPK